MLHRRHFLLLFLAGLSALALIAFACGGDDDDETDTPAVNTSTSAPAATPTFSPDSTMAQVIKEGKLVVGVKYDQPGFGYKNPITNKIEGFDVAMAMQIGRALGLREDQVELVEAVSRERIPLLESGSVDLVIATMTITEERREQINFSRSYFLAGQSILVHRDNTDIESVGDLNGRKVCTAQGSTSARNLAEKAPRSDPMLLDGYSSCVTALKDGRVDAVTTDDIILAGFAREDKALKLVGGQFTKEPYGIGVKKGHEDMVAFVDGVIQQMILDGTWEELYEQYLGGIEGLPAARQAVMALPSTY